MKMNQNLMLASLTLITICGSVIAAYNPAFGAQVLSFCSVLNVTLLGLLSRASQIESKSDHKNTQNRVDILVNGVVEKHLETIATLANEVAQVLGTSENIKRAKAAKEAHIKHQAMMEKE